jgi:DNA-binding response OmpR family regulator
VPLNFKIRRYMKVLLVEDEEELGISILKYLSNEQYLCEWAKDYSTAFSKIEAYNYSCIILDIGLPDGNGLALLEELKTLKKNNGVIIISARNELNDRIDGLNKGADDFLVKPFYLSELAARVSAIIRRKIFGGKQELAYNEIVVDLDHRSVTVNNKFIGLTKKEYELLVYFILNRDKTLSKSSIIEYLWNDYTNGGDDFDFLYSHIKNLRKKLMKLGCADYIQSLYGLGYRFGINFGYEA